MFSEDEEVCFIFLLSIVEYKQSSHFSPMLYSLVSVFLSTETLKIQVKMLCFDTEMLHFVPVF